MHTLRFLLPALLLVSCTQTVVPPAGTPQGASQSLASSRMAAPLPADPEHGELTYLGVGPLEGQDEVLANGTAAVWTFEDGTSRVSIQLNIAVAPSGKAYTAWIQQTNGGSFEKLGMLGNTAGDVRHSLTFEALKDYKRPSALIVTLESSTAASTPGPIVAKGILKETGR